MRRLHVVPAIDEANGVCHVARLLAQADGGEVRACSDVGRMDGFDEVIVHGMWLPREWIACWKAVRSKRRLVRMTHGSLSPVYLERQGKRKKQLVGPIERFFLRRSEKVLATCAAEKDWILAYEPKVKNVEVIDLMRFFRLDAPHRPASADNARRDFPSRVLYLGRRHPLKGVAFLERAVAEINRTVGQSNGRTLDFRVVSNAFGAEKEMVWKWCDVLCLPTLSENFGLVVAEALERGKAVIVTDGAPAWEAASPDGFGGRLTYVRGYRDGDDETRVRLLKEAICRVTGVKT